MGDSTNTMPAVSLWEPWATLIALGVKDIETRSWAPSPRLVGQRVAVHAANRDHGLGSPLVLGDWWHYAADPKSSLRREPARLRHRDGRTVRLNHGHVVATARLAAVAIMVDQSTRVEDGVKHAVVMGYDGQLQLEARDPHLVVTDVTDQKPYGDFAPGRWAWLLADVEPLARPVPAKGAQGVWTWTPPAEAVA